MVTVDTQVVDLQHEEMGFGLVKGPSPLRTHRTSTEFLSRTKVLETIQFGLRQREALMLISLYLSIFQRRAGSQTVLVIKLVLPIRVEADSVDSILFHRDTANDRNRCQECDRFALQSEPIERVLRRVLQFHACPIVIHFSSRLSRWRRRRTPTRLHPLCALPLLPAL